jgi:hypothetical protein
MLACCHGRCRAPEATSVREREFHGGDVGEKRGRDNEEKKEGEKEFVFRLLLFHP